MRTLIQTWIYRVWCDHCDARHGAEFEACSHPRCRRAWFVERTLYRWLYGIGLECE